MPITSALRIIIIDDNPQIHNDFIKILTPDISQNEELKKLEDDIFDNQSKQVKTVMLPKFQIDTASQGHEGVEYILKAFQEGNPYALAFVDIRMPHGLDGIETIKHIWEIDRDMQIVICTACCDDS